MTMPELSDRGRQLVQLLAEELDRTEAGWSVLMFGDGEIGNSSWDWRVDLVGPDGETVSFESNPGTNLADVIPINSVR